MSLLRSSRLLTAPRARLQIIPNVAARAQLRSLSSTAVRSAGDHAHEDHYDPPGGWLFGVKPGEKYENEGWENVWFYGFWGSMLFGVVGYCYKPDTRYACPLERDSNASCVYSVANEDYSIQTWALEEARRRLEAEGILEDPDKTKS